MTLMVRGALLSPTQYVAHLLQRSHLCARHLQHVLRLLHRHGCFLLHHKILGKRLHLC